MTYQRINFRITGASPLLMHNGQLADPLNYYAKELRRITSKRNKTEADYEQMAKIEFLGGLYLAEGEPCIPGELIEAAFTEAAKKRRQGQQAKAGVFADGLFPLHYDGPRAPEALWADQAFRLVAPVKVQRARVMRTRPLFRKWSADIHIDFEPTSLNRSEVIDIAAVMGGNVGLGDWRPKFGRFTTEVLQ